MKVAITVCGTKNYTFAAKDQAFRVQAMVKYADICSVDIIYVSDDEVKLAELEELYTRLLPTSRFHKVMTNAKEGPNYKEIAQLSIGKMRTAAFGAAMALGVDYCLSLDSDILPAVNGLESCLNALKFDKGYYGVASMLYTSQGGGLWLCGGGTNERRILPNFYDDELNIDKKYIGWRNKYQNKFKAAAKVKNVDGCKFYGKRVFWVNKLIDKKSRPKLKGNVWSLNGANYKKRGWFDFYAPGIGRGSIVPCDWCGFGATLMNKKALALTNFHGYEGKGTEDLYVIWDKWRPAGIKIAAVSHSICDHICRKKEGGYFMVKAWFGEGEVENHLRQTHLDYIPMA